MGKKLSLHQRWISSFIYLAIGIFILSGCATTSTNQTTPDESKAPVIESIKVSPFPEQTVVEIINSRSAPYAAFKLDNPPRIILDIRGRLGSDLSKTTDVNDGNVKEIRFEEGKTQTMTSRLVIGLLRPLDYQIDEEDNIIRLTLTAKQLATKVSEPIKAVASSPSQETEESNKAPVTPSEPRIFVKPGPSDLNQVLGVDFTMLDRGKSRLIVTTDKKVLYDLDRKGAKSLVLKLSDITIPPQLLREIDSSHFPGAVDQIKTSFSSAEKQVAIDISLREMVPFHLKQTDNDISIDFGRTSIKPVQKKIVPLQLAQAQAQPQPGAPEQPLGAGPVSAKQPTRIPGLIKAKYTGTPMTMDFVNADITNILRLIGEISKLNIIWGPEVTGNVSMRLKNVPWDQALDLILANNNLGKREMGNVIWISTKARISLIEAEEKKKVQEFKAEQKRKKDEEKRAKQEAIEKEPLVTEYIGIDFASLDDIKNHVEGVKSDRGTVNTDTRTNTLIIRDIASSREAAKDIVKKFDAPVKQIMIEARIVDAKDTFIRQLGVRWAQAQHQNKNLAQTPWAPWGTPATVTAPDPDTWTPGSNLYSPTFTTNAPADWGANLGLVFSKLSSFGLTATVLDAKLALAEQEDLVKTLSAPKVIASNGEAAEISRGDTLVIAATENVASTTLDATLSLKVTPTVSYNDFVTMIVEVTDDKATSASQLSTKSITTTLMVKSGETFVIGGIKTEIDTKSEQGVPLLRHIPLLGWLFKARYKKVEKTELLIFLTPTVLPSYSQS